MTRHRPRACWTSYVLCTALFACGARSSVSADESSASGKAGAGGEGGSAGKAGGGGKGGTSGRGGSSGKGGRAGNGGTAGTGGSGTIEMTGTWYARLATEAKLRIPIAQPTGFEADLNVDALLRVYISRVGASFVEQLQLCNLVLSLKSPATINIRFPPAVLATLRAEESVAASKPRVGQSLSFPTFVMQTGSEFPCTGVDPNRCQESDFVDSDQDGKPGVTLPLVASGFSVEAHMALAVSVALSPAGLENENEISATANLALDGQILRYSQSFLVGGPIQLTQSTPDQRIPLRRLASEVPCSRIPGN
jgi:hypothetical protein